MGRTGDTGGGVAGESLRTTLRFDAENAPPPPRPSAIVPAVPQAPSLRDEMMRLIRQYVTHGDRPAADEAAFRTWNAERSLGLARVLGTVFVTLIVVTWPGDLRFRGDYPEVFDAFVIWRAAAIGLLAPFIVADRIPIIRRHPLRAACVAYVGFVAILAYCMGRIGGLDAPWFYALYGAAWLTVVFPFAPLERLAWVAITTAAGVAAYFVPFPEHFDHPHVAIPLVNLASFSLVAALVGHIVHHLVRDNFFARRAVDVERARVEHLLRNMIPERVAGRLKNATGPIGDRFEEATVLFADIVAFTPLAGRVAPETLLRFLDDLFTRFDLIAERRGLEKIKTIGDSYVVAGGVPDPRPDHADAIADMALDMMAVVGTLRNPDGDPVELRIGIQSGPLVAGVIGVRKFTYDLWGDTVNTASRLESQGVPGRIQIGEACAARLAASFELEPRGTITLKGKGDVATWFLVGRRR